jgi:hypothetical protein
MVRMLGSHPLAHDAGIVGGWNKGFDVLFNCRLIPFLLSTAVCVHARQVCSPPQQGRPSLLATQAHALLLAHIRRAPT